MKYGRGAKSRYFVERERKKKKKKRKEREGERARKREERGARERPMRNVRSALYYYTIAREREARSRPIDFPAGA